MKSAVVLSQLSVSQCPGSVMVKKTVTVKKMSRTVVRREMVAA